MADFHATKHMSSSVNSKVHHQKSSQSNITLPPTQIASSQKYEGCIAVKMAKLKKSLHQLPVITNQISSRYFFQEYVTPIVHCATILKELKQKHQAILACQRDNAAANTKKKANKRAHQMNTQATERTQL